MVALADGRIVAFISDSSAPIAVLDRSGSVVERLSMPVPFSGRSFMLTQGQATSFSDGERWAYAFTMGPGWWGFQGIQPLSDLYPYLEKVDFPEMKIEEFEGDGKVDVTVSFAGDPLFAAHDLVLHDSLTYVRFGGRSRVAGRIVDRYRFDDGEYIGSYLLPGRLGGIPITWDRIAVLYGDPYPSLVWLTQRESLAYRPR